VALDWSYYWRASRPMGRASKATGLVAFVYFLPCSKRIHIGSIFLSFLSHKVPRFGCLGTFSASTLYIYGGGGSMQSRMMVFSSSDTAWTVTSLTLAILSYTAPWPCLLNDSNGGCFVGVAGFPGYWLCSTIAEHLS
jgi:hypothetical protein